MHSRPFAKAVRRCLSGGHGRRVTCSTLLLRRTLPDLQQATVQSHKLMLQAGLVRQSTAGVYHLLPLGMRALEKLVALVDQEMQAIGGAKVALSILSPAAQWKASGRWESIGSELFCLKGRTGGEFCLGPTHEEAVTELVSKEVTSHRQLPLRLYQIERKFRDEMRPRYGLLRGKEFWMKDMYSFDVNEDEAIATYHDVCGAYENIFTRLGLPVVKVSAATGNIGGTLSHEYHVSAPVGEDTLVICKSCGLGSNKELIVGSNIDTEHTSPVLPDCPTQGRDCQMEEVKGIEVAHTFFLGTKYSSVFDASFTDKDATRKLCSMGCYGVGISRLLQAVIEHGCDIHGSGNCLMWPLSIAPYLTYIVPLTMSEDPTDTYLVRAQELYDTLSREVCPGHVILDDRTHLTIGARLRDVKLFGYPCTVIIGPKASEGQYEVELQKGTEVETHFLTLSQVTQTVRDYYHKSLNM